jgi:endonuclease YncB( thermonuclease family)
LNHQPVRAGVAWHFVQYTKNDEALANPEASAKAKEHGLWAEKESVEPWIWR